MLRQLSHAICDADMQNGNFTYMQVGRWNLIRI